MPLSIRPGRRKGCTKTGGIKKGYQYDATLAAKSVKEQLTAIGFNPVIQLALIAEGDVVKLGWMSPDEFNQPAVLDDRGRLVQASGADRAAAMIPPQLRAKATGELIQYVEPRLAAQTISNPDGTNVTGVSVQFYLPQNNRQ